MSELIEKSYSEAVRGIKEEWFSSADPRWYDYIVNLPIHSQVVYMVVVLDDQLANGGFHQYFLNGYGPQLWRKRLASALGLVFSDLFFEMFLS